ncbi:glycine cleavage system protein GcvH [Candidatus Bathyarchaeota archaeon]|nr:glycine cleavage system protein GcvH [Candidatus Bathyarchaeota archaeon]
MKVNDYEVPADLHYTKEHTWVRVEDDKCRVGVTDYAQKALSEVVFVELPKTGSRVEHMKPAGTLESVKAVSDFFSPVSGEIMEVNTRLPDKPELLNESPYGDGWFAVIKPSNLEQELSALMDAEKYGELLRTIVEQK